jgi:Luciferase-like monooxygenase
LLGWKDDRGDDAIEQLRENSNPLFNDRKLKLGTFSSNLSGGCAISTIGGTLEATWDNTLELARLADSMQFEALVPVGRWKGFGGVTDFNGRGFETFSWAAGIAGATNYSGIFATSHVPTVHPIMAAKQATTIDHISRGRFFAQHRDRLVQARDRNVRSAANDSRRSI